MPTLCIMYVRFWKNEISVNDKIMGLINKYVGGKKQPKHGLEAKKNV